MHRRRSSSSITLVLISATAISACGQGPDTRRRDLYASRADCVQDWGSDPAKCEPVRSTTGTRTGTHYYGPAYTHGSYGSSTRTYSEGATSEARPGSRS